jgi:hypothetical protein
MSEASENNTSSIDLNGSDEFDKLKSYQALMKLLHFCSLLNQLVFVDFLYSFSIHPPYSDIVSTIMSYINPW